MALSDAAKNAMLDELGTLAGFMSLHSADPGTTGANELSGGSPGYARKAITWSAAAAGAKAISNQPVFDVEGGDTVAFVGFWSASTAGTFYGSDDVVSETFGAQGTYTVTSAQVSM